MPSPYCAGVTRTSTAGYTDVPAYSQVLQRPQAVVTCGWTVIVQTVSLHRCRVWTISSSLGFSRELCVWPLRIPCLQRCDEFFIAATALPTPVHRSSQREDFDEAV